MAAAEPRREIGFFQGCLLGGAVGDALGAPVEFKSLAEIRDRYGPAGIRDFDAAYGVRGAITDDTQMTLFTAEGIIRANNRGRSRDIVHVPTMAYHAYLRWHETQGERPRYPHPEVRSGWLLKLPALRARRAPGNTVLAALRGGRMGTIEEPLNDSKGCGGIMRIAPVGLAGADAFRLGCEIAATTHGHPSGYLAAGALAAIIAGMGRGAALPAALDAAVAELRRWPSHEECLAAIEAARRLARVGPPSPETVETLGGAWVAEETLAIALLCALTAESFEEGVVRAVNHGGDSDSTGAVAGNLLGALHGPAAIPSRWLDNLELRAEIEQIARDLFLHVTAPGAAEGAPDDWERYPG
jgi:ADP-ribosylglycohydrolase